MDKTYLNTLHKRKEELLRELNSINSILQLYPEEQVVTSEALTKKQDNQVITLKQRVLSIIKDFGGEAFVYQIVEELKKQLPNKDNESINTIARNYVHILKKENRLKGELKEKNKWLYHIV
jgi:hypothetical protein